MKATVYCAQRVLAVMLAAALLPACNAPKQAGGEDGLTDAEKRAEIDRMCEEYREAYPDVPELDVDEFVDLREEKPVVLVDGRSEEERAVSIIPGAIAAPEFEQNAAEYERRPVVCYCTIGYRSGKYAEKLREDGWDAYNLRGSILAWTHAGKPLVTPGGEETKRVHVYGEKWDLAAKGYESVW